MAIITPKLKDLKEPAYDTIKEIYECIEEVVVGILSGMLEKCPGVKEEL